MKKVLSFVAIAAITIFVASCGNDEAAKKMADSMRQDSLDKAAKHVSDSTMMANSKDSTDKANAAAMAKQHWMDSMKQDSMDKASKGGKKPMKPKETPKPKAGTGKG